MLVLVFAGPSGRPVAEPEAADKLLQPEDQSLSSLVADGSASSGGDGSSQHATHKLQKGSFLSKFLDGTAGGGREELRRSQSMGRPERPAISATHPPKAAHKHGGGTSDGSSARRADTSLPFFFGSDAGAAAPSRASEPPPAASGARHGAREPPELPRGGTRPLPASSPGRPNDLMAQFLEMARQIANFVDRASVCRVKIRTRLYVPQQQQQTTT